MRRLFIAVLIVVPIVELGGLLAVSKLIGGWPTFFFILLSGGIGVLLVRREGRKVWFTARRQMASGQIPGEAVLDGLSLLIAGIMLILPGFFTDLAGFLLALPRTRTVFRNWLLRYMRTRFIAGRFRWFW